MRRIVPFILVLFAAAGGHASGQTTLSGNPSQINLSATAGQTLAACGANCVTTASALKNVGLLSCGLPCSAPLSFTAAATSGGNWLSVSPTGTSTTPLTTPQTLTITANPAGLAAGNYTGSINLTCVPASDGSSTPIAVIFTVAPAITVCDPNGNCSPAQQPSLQFTLTQSRQSGSANLTVTSASGTVPFTVTYQTQSGGAGYPAGRAALQRREITASRSR